MLKRVKERLVRRNVKIFVPKDLEGFDEATLKVTWVLVPRTDEAKISYDREFFLGCVRNVEGYVDDEGREIAFTKEALAELLSEDFVLAGFAREYINCTVAAGRGN